MNAIEKMEKEDRLEVFCDEMSLAQGYIDCPFMYGLPMELDVTTCSHQCGECWADALTKQYEK
jgi:hypothetical protein